MVRRVFSVVLLSSIISACGATNSSSPPPWNPGGGGGGGGGYCAGGTIIPASGANPELCRTDTNLSAWFFWAFYLASNPPRLTPSNPLSQAAAVQPFISLQPGDVITWQATGRWDKWNSSGCNNYRDLEGYIGSDPTPAMNEGMPQGMLATDGTETALLGHSAIWQIQNYGSLYMGFNMSTWSTSCWEVYPSVFKHSRCKDSAGTVYACPF
jgi:hypothetical protein